MWLIHLEALLILWQTPTLATGEGLPRVGLGPAVRSLRLLAALLRSTPAWMIHLSMVVEQRRGARIDR